MIHTAHDARNEKRQADERRFSPAENKAKRMAATLKESPQIGCLVRNGAKVYYVTAPVYREAADPASLVDETENAIVADLRRDLARNLRASDELPEWQEEAALHLFEERRQIVADLRRYGVTKA